MKPIKFSKILKDLLDEKIEVEDLIQYRDMFSIYATKIISGKVASTDKELMAFLKLCNDYYNYSPDGDVLIPDSIYDKCMKVYNNGSNPPLIYADEINRKKWEIERHEIPGLVGSLDKIYDYRELKEWLSSYDYRKSNIFILAPKFDGISAAIKITNGKIEKALTRYNGIFGQNITSLIKNAKNANMFSETKDGYYKCELCVSHDDFESLNSIKKYSNRRSATSGIVNTPTNIPLGKYITIIPLVYYDPKLDRLSYVAPDTERVYYISPADLLDNIENMLYRIKDKSYPFRVDGVVINPETGISGYKPNLGNIMDKSIAYKINTSEAMTKIEYGYMSIGRLGKAVPMLKLQPVEVNETTVTDVNIGSYEKFLQMDLRENESVIVYSAGDVIPQIRLPEIRQITYGDPLLRIKKVCPYCGCILERKGAEYYCTNENCERIITGRIANFIDKIGGENISDKTVELLYENNCIRNIPDIFNLTLDKLLEINGIEITSANNLLDEIDRLKKSYIPVAKFFGALGIEKISEKKCRKIFEMVRGNIIMDIAFNGSKKDKTKLIDTILHADGINILTAKTFVNFVFDNCRMIQDLINILNIVDDRRYIGNVAFTGCRPDNTTRNRLEVLGYEAVDSITSKTVALVRANPAVNTAKVNMAYSKNIPIYNMHEIEDLIKYLRS